MAEFISLWWDMDEPPLYVRGHVSDAEAIQSAEAEVGEGYYSGYVIAHKWARWEFPADNERADGNERTFRAYDTQHRGCFRVTELRASKREEREL